MLAPVSKALIDRAAAKTGDRVIDVGCGCGSTSIAFAERAAPNGFVLGVDISGPMLSRARQLAPKGLPVDFVQADATVYPFDPGSFDLVVSRFGVMFFAEPAISLPICRRRCGHRAAWPLPAGVSRRENPWMMAPLAAIYSTCRSRRPQTPEDPVPSPLPRRSG